MVMTQKRGPGRPKKGRASWKPAEKLDLLNKEPGWRYRWCEKDDVNLVKKQSEGWEYTNTEHKHPENVGDGHPLTSITEYREMVAMRLPEERAKARDEYHENINQRNIQSIKERAQDDFDGQRESGNRAVVDGKVIIE